MLEFAIALFLLLVSALFSARADHRQTAKIQAREAELTDIVVFNERTPPENAGRPYLVSGSVVVAVSYFKIFVGALQGLFGGRIVQYELSIENARRMALIRMRREARAQGANMIINVRLETSAISKQNAQQSVGAVEVLAYGTAISVAEPGVQSPL